MLPVSKCGTCRKDLARGLRQEGRPEETVPTTCHRWPEAVSLEVVESQEASRRDSSHKEGTAARGMDRPERQQRRKLLWPFACPEGTRADPHCPSLLSSTSTPRGA